MLSQKYHHYIFLFGTALLVMGMPVSLFILSVAQLILIINWLLEGDFKHKFYLLKTRKAILIFISIYFIHLLGLFNTNDFFKTIYELVLLGANSKFLDIIPNIKEVNLPSNFLFALHDLRIKLPLLALPLIYGTSAPLSKKEFKIIMQLFVATVLVNTFITSYVLFGFSDIELVDARYASLFISHIRFSLIIVLSIFSLLYLIFSNQFKLYKREKIISLCIIVWLLCFLILLKSFTGIVIILLLSPVAFIWLASLQKNSRMIKISYLSSIILVIGAIAYLLFSYHRYIQKYDDDLYSMDTQTINGNLYTHNTASDEYENGFKIWINVCEKELADEWNQKSIYKYDSLDIKGQPVRTTLIRYMTSLGYTKDSLGISSLDADDIMMVERGYTNYLYKNKFALYPKIYELFWEIERYNKGFNPNGQSTAQRIEYLKTGVHIIQNNFWFGTGTGDVADEINMQYIRDDSKLNSKYRLRIHNQFITFFVSFGVFAFIWILFAFGFPPVLENKYRNFMFLIFFLIGILSMLNEDTLETHVGVSFFAFFYSFFLFSMPEDESVPNKN